jgi:hypothetical protein
VTTAQAVEIEPRVAQRAQTGPTLLDPPAPEGPRQNLRPNGSEGPRLTPDPVHEPRQSNIVRTSAEERHTTKSTPAASPRKDLPKRQFVNQAKVLLDYQVENAGPAAGTIEVWITRDAGEKWVKLREIAQGKSPVEVSFPEDGLYGVTLVVNNGHSAAAPASGDAPDWMIEVDTVKPSASITGLESVHEQEKNIVEISWSVHDSNLGETPVGLYHSTTPQGPWTPIAKGLRPEGKYRWTPPTNIGAQAFLRLVARDLAGNVSISGTVEPIHFEEQPRPRALIRGIRTESKSSSGADDY